MQYYKTEAADRALAAASVGLDSEAAAENYAELCELESKNAGTVMMQEAVLACIRAGGVMREYFLSTHFSRFRIRVTVWVSYMQSAVGF